VVRLQAAGIDKLFPYQALDARDGAEGVGIWSRYPLVKSLRIDGHQLAMLSARIRVGQAHVDPTILVALLPGPWPQPIDDWVRDLRRLPGTFADVSIRSENGCVIVAGDFSNTLDMKPFRQLLADGYRDAVEQAGAGYLPTYPANSHVPPFMAIDHVLTSRCSARSADTVGLPGSDHRGLATTIDVLAL
jgi:endonuclease/exonuclease/phosphatase (EEP) superfamily protein YafD